MIKANKQTIKEIPITERPYEKYRQRGADFLSDAELLAVILRSGTRDTSCVELARQVLSLASGEQGLLGIHELSDAQLMELKGIGPVKAAQLACIGELCKRMVDTRRAEGLRLTEPKLVADMYMEQLRHLPQEHILLLLLDSKCKLLKEITLAIGTVNQAVLTPREVFISAFQYRAVSMLLLHNHPSGDPMPSKADILVTERIRQVGELVGISLMDHIIIGDCQYISLKEQGILEA